ncbi:hypothetical protein BDN72DRAFT_721051, partial [Pluteus cervinus]
TIPAEDTRWGICGTPDCHHFWHVDVAGFSTKVEVKCGIKLWFIAREKRLNDFSKPTLYRRNYNVTAMNLDMWDIELVVLRAGDELYQQPNTPHCVYTAESAICHGAYLYSLATIQRSVHGLLHCFVRGVVLTNVGFLATSRRLLCRIITFWRDALPSFPDRTHEKDHHLPDLSNFDGVMDMLTLCAFMEL